MGLNMQDQSGSQNSNTTGTSNTTANTTANPTQDWSAVSGQLKNLLGPNGTSPDQQQASSSWSNYLADPNNGVSQMIQSNKLFAPFTSQPAHQAGATSTVSAPTAASGMDAYQNPFQQQVVDATKADADQTFKEALNTINSNYGGSMGNGRAGVAAGQAAGDYTRGLNTTLGNLRSQGFTTAMQGGQFDAGNALSASNANAGYTQQNNQFNTQQQNLSDQQRMQAIQQMIGNAGTEQQLGGQANIIQSQLGGTGLGNMINFLGTQVPAFGQDTKSKTDWNSSTAGNSSQSGTSAKL